MAVLLTLLCAIAIATSAVFALNFVFSFLVARGTSPASLSSSRGFGVGCIDVEVWGYRYVT